MLACWPHLAITISHLAKCPLSSLAPSSLGPGTNLSNLSAPALQELPVASEKNLSLIEEWACMCERAWAHVLVYDPERLPGTRCLESRSGYRSLFLFPAIPIVYWIWDADNHSGVRWSSSRVSLLPTGLENIPLPFVPALSSPFVLLDKRSKTLTQK